MRKTTFLAVAVFLFAAVPMQATDVINQDNKPYHIKVQSEGKLSISYYDVKPKSSMYGLCSASFCTFEIPGSKISAKKDDKLVIRDGKFSLL